MNKLKTLLTFSLLIGNLVLLGGIYYAIEQPVESDVLEAEGEIVHYRADICRRRLGRVMRELEFSAESRRMFRRHVCVLTGQPLSCKPTANQMEDELDRQWIACLNGADI